MERFAPITMALRGVELRALRCRAAARAIKLSMVAVCGLAIWSCGNLAAPLLPDESTDAIDLGRFELLARLVHISDSQIIDEESPARLTPLAGLSDSAWRPQEAYSTQLLDGMIRTVNKMHVALHPIDFLVHTGDALENAQHNELDWFITAMEGGRIDPRSGPDDRSPEDVPDALLDPHHSFDALGLYREGVHGTAPTIRWYGVFGNHDRFGLGVFPIVNNVFGHRTSPLPLSNRIGLFLPRELDPVGSLSWAPITPAHSGPPPGLTLPTLITPNPDRRYITDREFVSAHWGPDARPPGHGYAPPDQGETWYSVSSVPGLRLIGLNSSVPPLEIPTLIYSEGAINVAQRAFLERELRAADAAGEVVIVATHHPAQDLDRTIGTALTSAGFVSLLNRHPSVLLHLAGHQHANSVIDRGGYVEVLTSSIIDAPQEGRVIEIWREIMPPDAAETGEREVQLRYRSFSHLDEIAPPDDVESIVFDDPLMELRRVAAELAGGQ